MNKREGESLKNRLRIIDDFSIQLADPVHKKILEAYDSENPVESMEEALSEFLEEIASNED